MNTVEKRIFINDYTPEKGDKNPDVEGEGHETYDSYRI